LAVLLFLPAQSKASINRQINFQGKLTNPDGTNVTDGSYSIRFRIYNHVSNDASNSCVANSCQWEETQGSVSINDGIFYVSLGSVASLPGSVDFNSTPLYLGIKVGADAEMTPRIQFTASPYAFNADLLDGIDSTAFSQLSADQSFTGKNTFSRNGSGAGDYVLGLTGTPINNATSSLLSIGGSIAGGNSSTNGGTYIGLNVPGSGAGSAADILNFQNNGTSVLQVTSTGASLFKNSTDSTTAFQVQTSGSSTAVLSVDTSNEIVNVNGNLTINTSDNNIVRTSLADFALGTIGSDLTNVTSPSGQLELSDGTIPNSGTGTITTAGQPTSNTIGAGGFAITRPDGKYFIVRGGASTATDIYDSRAGTFTTCTAASTNCVLAQTLNNAAGAGALALPRPTGQYRIIHGGGATTNSLVDPSGSTAVTASIATLNASNAGTIAFKRADGKYLIGNGGGNTSNIYDPVADTFTNGSVPGTAWGAGSLSLPRPDGQALMIIGGATSTTVVYNPNSSALGAFSTGPSLDGVQAAGTCGINGNGSVALRRSDGKYVIVSKASVSTIYDPVANTFTCRSANGPASALGDGAHAIPLQNGKFLIIRGGATTTSFIYDPSTDTFSSHGTNLTSTSTGAFSLMKQDGTWQLFNGGTTTNNYNTGLPMTGTTTKYTSDDISTTALNDSSTLKWSAQFESPFTGNNAATNTAYSTIQFLVRTATNGGSCTTALNSATDREVQSSGDFIRPSSTDNCIRVTAQFNRPLPKRITDERGTWTGNGSTVLRLDYATPTLFDLAIDNSTVLHRDNFTFSQPSAQDYNNGTIPSALTSGAPSAGGSCTAGTHYWFVTFVTNGSESRPSAASTVQTCTGPNGTVGLSSIPLGPTGTTARKIYRTKAGAANTDTPFLLTTISDNSTTIFSDTIADGSLGSAVATGETSGPTTTRAEAVNGNLTLPSGRIAPSGTQIGTTGFYTGAVSGAHPALNQAQTNNGTIVIVRPNKTFVIIASLTVPAANASIYDPATQTFTAQSSTSIPTAANGAGGFAVKRPDGKFLVVLGNGTTTTNIYDPDNNTFSAGPALTVAAGAGASAIPNTDGSFTIVHGGAATSTSIYEPVRNTMIVGPTLPVAANCGFWAIPRPKTNQYLAFFGVASGVVGITTTTTYDANTKVFSATAKSPALPLAAGCGAFAFQRQDGLWVTIAGGGGAAGAGQSANGSMAIYNPDTGVISASGAALAAATQQGAFAIPRADGTFLIFNGNAATTTQLYNPSGGGTSTMTAAGPPGSNTVAGPAAAAAIGAGGLTFQRPDGKWVIINGNATQTTMLYDAGWYADGQYLSEQIQVPALAANSVLNWRQNNDNFVRMEVRTASSQAALSTTGFTSVGRPGSSIGNSGGETWVQVEVNFRRDFPTYGGALSGVYTSGGGQAYSYRTIAQPAVSSYDINNGNDLLTLQDDGLNVFRVSSEGNIYSSSTGGFYSGGADLAENYTSTEALEAGDVVSTDRTSAHGVKRSTGQYQTDVLGVVSTAPGFVAGSFTEDSHPIALVGRVPVKISTENGDIHEGDFLTSASIPGYAMKATVAGRVIGSALEDFDISKATTCPAEGLGNKETTKCGTVTVFVNLTDYQGSKIEALMADDNNGQVYGDAVISGADFPDINGLVGDKQEKILGFLKNLKTKQANGEAPVGGDILANRVNVVDELISPVIVADIIRAKTIQATRIEGLEVYTDKIASLEQAYAGLEDQPSFHTTTSSTDNLGSVEFGSGQFLSLVSLGNIEARGGLIVDGDANFKGRVTFASLVEFMSGANFAGDVSFGGQTTFGNNSGGLVIIKKDATRAEVLFKKEYTSKPLVSLSLQANEDTLADGTKEDIKLKEERLFSQGYNYLISNLTTKGFTIVLNKKASEDLQFSWNAVLIKDPSTITSQDE